MRIDLHAITRPALVMHATAQALAHSGLNVQKFAARVAESYLEKVPEHFRDAKFFQPLGTTAQILHAEKRNGEIVTRFLQGVVKFPASLEECWVDALPEPFRTDLVRELAKRYGLLGARARGSSLGEHLAALSDVLTDAGKTACALAPVFADGKVTPEDAPHLVGALIAIDRSVADLASLREQIARYGCVKAQA